MSIKCPNCDGSGRRMEESDNGIGWIHVKCEYCNGTGILEQTNDEYRRTCSTEEFAQLLFDILYGYQVPWKNKGVFEWLKQPHTIKE